MDFGECDFESKTWDGVDVDRSLVDLFSLYDSNQTEIVVKHHLFILLRGGAPCARKAKITFKIICFIYKHSTNIWFTFALTLF